MGLQRFPFTNFYGGVNLQDGPFELDPGEAQSALNATLTQRGIISQRPGKTSLATTGFPGSKHVEFARNWYAGSTRVLMCSIDGTIYSMSTGGAFTSRFAGTAGTIWDFEGAQDGTGVSQVWMMNGTDAPKKWDGTTFANWANTPPNGTMLRIWKNRMIISGVPGFPNRVFFSDIANPESPAATYGTNWIDIKSSEDDVEPVTWMDLVGDVLIIFKKRSVWAVFDPTTFANHKLGTPGCEDRFQSVYLLGQLYYLCRDGIYTVSPNSAPELVTRQITPYFANTINHAAWQKARMGVSRDRRVFCAVPTGSSTENNRLIEGIPEAATAKRVGGHYVTSIPWMFHDLAAASLTTFRIGNNDDLFAGDPVNAKLHTLFTGTNDDGAAIDSHYFTSWRGLLTEEPLERLRRINMEISGDVTLDLFQDLHSDNPVWSRRFSDVIDPDPLWDGGPWDGGTWDPTSFGARFVRGRPDKRGRYHALKYRNNELNKTWTIFTTEVALRGGKEHTK